MTNNKLIWIAGALLINGSVHAADNDAEGKGTVWSGKGQLGFSMASGNSDSDNLNGSVELKIESEKWVNQSKLEAQYASSDGETTTDRFVFSGKTGYKWRDADHFFYASRYENDDFSGYDYTMSASVGWGHKFFESDKSKLLTELALGYKVQAVDADRSEVSGAILVGKMDYMRQLTETTKFEDVLLIESGSDNTYIQNDMGVALKVNEAFAVKLNYQYRHNTDVPAGKEKTDELISANLVYDF
ncbi:DUF481 domain-containing protein [Marinicella rhabdoformis]|uniref:DUF481 domain-containing protein n=1 Tax=Marinicella rhabdoformis TaxID=2580566 RepID=UPI0015CFDD39|nr:DUF481 domain-containing protein [Marinicella rhabdoformis]